MQQFRYIVLEGQGSGIVAKSTSDEDMEYIYKKLIEVIPTCQKDTIPYEAGIRFHKLNNKDFELTWQLIRDLVHSGWELFTVVSNVHSRTAQNIETYPQYYLRKKEENTLDPPTNM